MDHLEEMRAWARDLRLSSSSSSDQDCTIRNEMIKEEELSGDYEEKIEVDITKQFLIETVFDSRQSLTDWVQAIGRNLGFIIVTRSSSSSSLLLQCDRSGMYRGKKSSTKQTGTKKLDCPFRLKWLKLHGADEWMVRVICGMHNHAPASYMEGHPYVGRLSESEFEMMVDMSSNRVKPRDILSSLKKRDPANASTIKTIYNARQKFRTSEKAGKSHIQSLMSFLHEHMYIFYYRTDDITNELQDLFFSHPDSLALLRAFPHVLLMDATYKTNRFKMPLLEIVGVTSTNMTYCIAFVLLNSEKEDNYAWALTCLRSTIEESVAPRVIVTDRELALMKSCAMVFPAANNLLCRWHINRAILANCKRFFQDKESWNAFYSSWNTLVESENETAYVYNLSHLEVILQNFAVVVNYIKDVWLTPYKEMFVSAWTNTYLHFGNLTTNRVESQHAKLKKYLGSSQSDIESIISLIHQLVQAQATSIKASMEKSRHIIQHRFNIDRFKELRGFVSIAALNLIFNESEKCEVVRYDSYACGCKLRTSYGLPCAHEISIYIHDSQPIPLSSIDVFWKKLDLSPCVSLRDDDIDCTVELQMFAEKFKRHSRSGKFSLLRKIREIIKPSTTVVQDPVVKKSTRGRPSSKKKANMHTQCNPIAPDYVEQSRHSISVGRLSSMKKADGVTHTNSSHHSQQPGRHSCSSLYSSRSSNVTYEHIYIRQFPPILHPYIVAVQDVIPDGNCGFRAIAVGLGFGEHAWDIIRRDLISELGAFWHEYVTMFGSKEHALGIHNTLNFFESDKAAPTQHWMIMPDMGLLIFSRYNVILHVVSSRQSFTYLPLRSTPPPQYQHVVITLGHVNDNHYVQVSLTGSYPMPTIMPQWHYFRYECAAAWVLSYMEQLDAYRQQIRPRFPHAPTEPTIVKD